MPNLRHLDRTGGNPPGGVRIGFRFSCSIAARHVIPSRTVAGRGGPWQAVAINIETRRATAGDRKRTAPETRWRIHGKSLLRGCGKGSTAAVVVLNPPLGTDMLNGLVTDRLGKHPAKTPPHRRKCGAYLIRMIQDSLSHTHSSSRWLSMPRRQEEKRHPPPQQRANGGVRTGPHLCTGGQLLSPATILEYLFTIDFVGPFWFHHAKSFASDPVASSLTNILGPDGPRGVTSPFCMWNE